MVNPAFHYPFSIINYFKKSISRKPDSVIPASRDGYHLSGCAITNTILLPTLQRFVNESDEPPSNADIRGITAHKVYP